MAVGLGGFAVERARAQETIPTFVVKWAGIRLFTEETPYPYGVAVPDAIGVNGPDGLPDPVVGSSWVRLLGDNGGDPLQPGKITILRNTGNWTGPTGGLEIFQDIVLDHTVMIGDVAFAGVDNDFDLDVIAAAGRTVVNDGELPGLYVSRLIDGAYEDPPAYYDTLPAGGALHGFRGMAVADLNDDGKGDIITSNHHSPAYGMAVLLSQ